MASSQAAASHWLQQQLLDLSSNPNSDVQLDPDVVSSLVSYCERGSPEDAEEYLRNIVGLESCKDIVSGYFLRRGVTRPSKDGDYVQKGVMHAYLKPQADEIWSSSAKKITRTSKPKIGSSDSKRNSTPNTSKDGDLSGVGKSGGTKAKKGVKGMSLAEAAEGRILIPRGTPCSCQATRHKLVNNCLSCGKIVCEQEGEGPCKFCGALVLREGSNYAGIEGTALPFSDTEAAAQAFKDRLVEYDRTSSQRTAVIDDQGDYFQVDGDAWLSEEEKLLLQKRQEESQQAEEARKKKVVVTIDLLGRKVVMAGDADTDLDIKTSILGGTVVGERFTSTRIKPNPYISETPMFVDVKPSKDAMYNKLGRRNQRQPTSHNLAESGRVQHDDPFVEALSSGVLKDEQNSTWQGTKLKKGSDKLCYGDEDCFQESNQSTSRFPSSVFDICQAEMSGAPGTDKLVVLSPSTLVQKRAERKLMMNNGGKTALILMPGMVLLKYWLDAHEQVEIVKLCRMLGVGPGGFYKPGYGDENKLHLRMMCLGKHWEPTTRSYEPRRSSYDNATPPTIPPLFINLVRMALLAAQDAIQDENRRSSIKDKHELLPDMQPEVCLVNFYEHNGKLGMHQDRDESPESLQKGIPVVSFSIGDSADFLYGRDRSVDEAEHVTLESGDILLFGGSSRLIFHGVEQVLPQTTPPWLINDTNLRPGRINLTFRQL